MKKNNKPQEEVTPATATPAKPNPLAHLLPNVKVVTVAEAPVAEHSAEAYESLPTSITTHLYRLNFEVPRTVKFRAPSGDSKPGVAGYILYKVLKIQSKAQETFGQWLDKVSAELHGFKQAKGGGGEPLFTTDETGQETPVLVTTDEEGNPLEPALLLSFTVEWGEDENKLMSKRLKGQNELFVRAGLNCPTKSKTTTKEDGSERTQQFNNIDWNQNTGLEDVVLNPLRFATDEALLEVISFIPEGATSVKAKKARAEAQAGFSSMVGNDSTTISDKPFPGAPENDEPEKAPGEEA